MNHALYNNQQVVTAGGAVAPSAGFRREVGHLMIVVNTAFNRQVDLVDTDGLPVTGATLTISLSKDGGAFASITPAVTERGNGAYSIALTPTHNNTIGSHTMYITTAGAAVPQFVYDQVVLEPANQAALTVVDDFLDTEISGLVTSMAALNNVSVAQVRAEVVAALTTDAYGEPGQGAPPVTASVAAKLNYLYKAWRNRSTQTATEYSLYADNSTVRDQKADVTDDLVTFDRREIGSGP